jgi:hypothetical protein
MLAIIRILGLCTYTLISTSPAVAEKLPLLSQVSSGTPHLCCFDVLLGGSQTGYSVV